MSDAARRALVRRGTIASVLLLVIFLAAWQWGPGLLGIPHFIIPPLSMVAEEFVRMWQVNHLLMHTGVTAGEVVAGFIIGSLLGALIGYLLGMSPTAEFALSPYILALQLISLSILALTHSGVFNVQFWLLWAAALPAVLLGSSAGVALYRRMNEVNFRRATLILLIVSGVSLLAKTLI